MANATMTDVAKKIGENFTAVDERTKKAAFIDQLIDNNGYADKVDGMYNSDDRVLLKDLLNTPDVVGLLPQVISNRVIRSMEPILTLSKMLRPIAYHGKMIEVPVFGGFGGNFDIPTGGEPQHRTLDAAAYETINIGKSGLVVDIPEEAISDSMFDIVALHLDEAGKALARWKEKKVAKELLSYATEVFNNDGGTPTTGKGSNGTSNGGLSLDDVVAMATQVINNGFNPNIMIIHPLAFQMLLLNGEFRSYFWKSMGTLPVEYNWPQTQTVQPTELSAYQGLYEPTNQIVSMKLPNFLGRNLTVVLSPFMPYDNSGTPKTDVLVADADALGYMVIDYLPKTTEFVDPIRQITSFPVIERYGIGPSYNGSAIVAAKNVNVVKTYSFDAFYSVTPS
jgi:hypothetical protein